MSQSTERNLLFGLLALQTGMIEQSALVAAFHAWTRDKPRSMAEILVEQGGIEAEDCAAVEALVARHVKKHGGDPEKSLAALQVGRSARAGLVELGDPDIEATLARIIPGAVPGSGPDPTEGDGDRGPDRTATISVGSVGGISGDGQRFRLLRPHARGGLGAVFVALDAELNREVALKQILEHHADDPASRTRFVLEAEITGGLEHPGIVPVYGLGSSGDGRPYYAMRLIRGDSLKEAIAAFHKDDGGKADASRRSLALRMLLRRFVDVCNAIDYAHTRGVLHRDIKPANVIVGKHGETLVVDWGLAKALGKSEPGLPSGERTLMPSSASGSAETLPGSAMGTPSYMSPEQAAGNLDHVGPRSDVYSLGATLYCLLTGKPPFEGDDLGAVLRAVGKGDFPPPRKLDAAIPRALEATCLKAMALNPGDRYATSRGLADDVERWMADEPVSSYREPLAIRTSRWARRHRTLVASVGMLLVAAVVGLTVGTILLGQANAQTEAQRRRAEALRLTAESNFQKARQAVDEYFTKVSESKLLNVPGLQPLRKELLESSRKYYQEFLKDHADDPSVRAEAAEAWYRVGFVTMYIKPGKEALDAFQKAADMYDQLARQHPEVERYKYKLAMCLNDLGNEQAALGLESEANKTHERCLAIRQQVVRDHPDVPEYQKELGIGYQVWAERQYALGLTSESLRSNEQARDLFGRLVREHPDVADYRNRLAGALVDIGMRKGEIGLPDEAIHSLHQSLELYERLNREHPDIISHQRGLIGVQTQIGWTYYRLSDRPADAATALRNAKTLAEKVVRDNPDLLTARTTLANLDHELGRVLVRMGQFDEALTLYKSVLSFQEQQGPGDSGGAWQDWELGYIHLELGRLHRAAGREAVALESLTKAVGLFERVADAQAVGPYNRACAQAICAGLVGLGKKDLSAEDQTRRRKLSEQAVATLRQAAKGGLHSVEMIASDNDFEAIRSNDDFRALMAELKAHRK